MKIEDLTICPAWMDCFIAKKNKNGTMSVQRKALTDNEMLEVVAFYGSNRLETGYKQDLPLRDGTKVVIVHTEGDKDEKTEKPTWHTLDEKADPSKSILMYDVDGNYMSPPVRCPFSFDDFFVKTMNKKYGANYTMWAYMDDIKPKAKPKDETNETEK